MLTNKRNCADIYCITLSELQAHLDALIQNSNKVFQKAVPSLDVTNPSSLLLSISIVFWTFLFPLLLNNTLSFHTWSVQLISIILGPHISKLPMYRMSLSPEAPNYCLCIQSNSRGFLSVNTGKQVNLKHTRRHFERNLLKDLHHRNVASRNWLKS